MISFFVPLLRRFLQCLGNFSAKLYSTWTIQKKELQNVLIVDINTLIGWLEPLLDRIAEDKRNVVYPQMPNIKDDTLEFRAFSARNIQVGRFDWQLIFRWMELPEYINKTRKSFISPTRCVEYK